MIQTLTKPWGRYSDPKNAPVKPNPVNIHCFDQIEDLVHLCTSISPDSRLKAAGSHWALSEITVSDGEFIETNWPGSEDVPRHSGLDIDIGELISGQMLDYMIAHPPAPSGSAETDPCQNESLEGAFFVHLKSGTRIYDAYRLLDQPTRTPGTLAAILNEKVPGQFQGPWAFMTLGGSGGQTVFGALTTGTHGGDYKQRPISDSVVAVHLVTAGGAHYWIEPDLASRYATNPKQIVDIAGLTLTDDDKLRAIYGNIVPQGSNSPSPFKIIRDNDIFDAVVISGGRFGVVASIVLRVVPQYCLHEHRVLENWSEIKKILLGTTKHHFFEHPYFPLENASRDLEIRAFTEKFNSTPESIHNRFLQIVVNTCPHLGSEHLCGVTQRWLVGHSGGNIPGRSSRGTIETAGKNFSYLPEDDKKTGDQNTGSGTILTKACSRGDFVTGILEEIGKELALIVAKNGVAIGSVVLGTILIGGGAIVLALAIICAALLAAILIIAALIKLLSDDDLSFAEVLNEIVSRFLKATDSGEIPKEIGIMILRTIFLEIFKSQQSKHDFEAISYAVMDLHDYKDQSCVIEPESIEVFFDANKPDIYCAYIDKILEFEANQQEFNGRASVSYIAMRYVRGSHGLIAPSRFEETVVLEIAGLRKVAGSLEFVDNAAEVARHKMFNVPFHWGQKNPLTRPDVENIFNAEPKPGALDTWRKVLEKLTEGAHQDAFSSEFTRRAGLEI
jgi:hypothetical protein